MAQRINIATRRRISKDGRIDTVFEPAVHFVSPARQCTAKIWAELFATGEKNGYSWSGARRDARPRATRLVTLHSWGGRLRPIQGRSLVCQATPQTGSSHLPTSFSD